SVSGAQRRTWKAARVRDYSASMRRTLEQGTDHVVRSSSCAESPWRERKCSLSGPPPNKKSPADAGLFRKATRYLTPGSLALHFDLDAAIRRQAIDERLALLRIGLVAHYARNRLRLAHAEGFDLIPRDTLGDQVIAHRVGAALGELLVVRLRADTIGVAGDEHELELGDVAQTAHH